MNAWLAKPIPLGMVYCEPGEAFCNTVLEADEMFLIVGRLIPRQFGPRASLRDNRPPHRDQRGFLRRTIELF
jgi:hypothetical protein